MYTSNVPAEGIGSECMHEVWDIAPRARQVQFEKSVHVSELAVLASGVIANAADESPFSVDEESFQIWDVSQGLCKLKDATTLGAGVVGGPTDKQVLEVHFQKPHQSFKL